MGYNNKPNNIDKTPVNYHYGKKNNSNFNSHYNKNNGGNTYPKYKLSGGGNTYFAKDDDIYTPKTYAKKVKPKTQFDDIVIPEYEMEKQKMRNKRNNDKKYKNKKYINFD